MNRRDAIKAVMALRVVETHHPGERRRRRPSDQRWHVLGVRISHRRSTRPSQRTLASEQRVRSAAPLDSPNR